MPRRQPILTRRMRAIAAWTLIALIAIAAAINVPWAVALIRSSDEVARINTEDRSGPEMPLQWPAATPHTHPWPSPNAWDDGHDFGCRVFNVFGPGSTEGKNGFQMELQQAGWPLPVIELKQMWWDWDDPKLGGPENDPAPSLVPAGLLLNPLILGGAAWIILILPWLAFAAIRRWLRRNYDRCMSCGYPIGTSLLCTECGTQVSVANARHDPSDSA